MPVLVYSSPDAEDLVSRLRRVISGVDLYCRCRARLDGALDRFTGLEHRRQARKAMADARQQRDQIIARLAFLAEIDELTEQEADTTVFSETATLFDEIATAACDAARSIRACAILLQKKYNPRAGEFLPHVRSVVGNLHRGLDYGDGAEADWKEMCP